MTQKTTLPGNFTGPLVATLPQYLHGAPVTAGLVRRYVAAAQDLSKVGSAVASLEDLTGKGAPLAQADPALRPTLRQSGQIRYLEFNGDAMAGDNSGGMSYALVAKMRALPAAGDLHPLIQLGPFGDGALSVQPNNTLIAYGNASLVGSFGPGAGWHVFYASYAGTGSVLRMDDAEVTGNAGTSRHLGTTIGRSLGNAAVAPVDVAEVLIWDRALNATERARTVSELKTAYGI